MFVEIVIATETRRFNDKDILNIITSDRAKTIHDQMLASGKMKQAEYDNAQILPGVFRYPTGGEQQYQTLILVSDETFTEEEIIEFTRRGADKRPVYYLDYNSVLSEGEVVIAKDLNQVYVCDYENPMKLKNSIKKWLP